MSGELTKSIVEQAALAWLSGMGYQIISGPDIAPGESLAERTVGRAV